MGFMARIRIGDDPGRVLVLCLLLPPLLLGCATQEDMEKEFLIEGRPYIDSIVPSSAMPGQTINLRGFNFGAETGQLFVGDGGTGAIIPMEVDLWREDFIVARVPQTTYVNVEVPLSLITSDQRQLPIVPNLRVIGVPAQN
jgi:hypothetical protein